jgi:phospholipase C
MRLAFERKPKLSRSIITVGILILDLLTVASTPVQSNAILTSAATINHAIIIVMENAAYGDVYGSSDAPYMTSIADKYSLLTNFYAITHPSLPNYLTMIAGSGFEITDDSAPANHTSIAGDAELTSLLKSKGVTWKTYQESMPSPCYKLSSGEYAVKHNPFVYFSDVTADSTYCNSHVVDFNALNNDIANNALPKYVFITPNLKNDGHDTSVNYADNWLKGFLPKLINSPSFSSSIIFVTYDEDDNNSANHIYTAAVGPSTIVKQGFKSVSKYDHYSMLATIEDIFSLGNLGRSDASATVMKDIFAVPVSANGGGSSDSGGNTTSPNTH